MDDEAFERAADKNHGDLDENRRSGAIDRHIGARDETPALSGGMQAVDWTVTGDTALLRQQFADYHTALLQFAREAQVVLQVAIVAVGGPTSSVTHVATGLTDYDALLSDFGAHEQLGLHLLFMPTKAETELPAAALVPFDHAGQLLGLDFSQASAAVESFDGEQMHRIVQRVRELTDFMTITLLRDGVYGAEVRVSGARRGAIEPTLSHLRDAVGDGPLVRVDLSVGPGADPPIQVTLILPGALLGRVVELNDEGDASRDGNVGGSWDVRGDDFSPSVSALGSRGLRPSLERVDGFHESDAVDDERATTRPLHSRSPRAAESPGTPGSFIGVGLDGSRRVAAELGWASLAVEEILELEAGSLVKLNKLMGEPVDILVNDHIIARGEVIIVDGSVGVRITEIVSPHQRGSAMRL